MAKAMGLNLVVLNLPAFAIALWGRWHYVRWSAYHSFDSARFFTYRWKSDFELAQW
jgi:hypothetical protein